MSQTLRDEEHHPASLNNAAIPTKERENSAVKLTKAFYVMTGVVLVCHLLAATAGLAANTGAITVNGSPIGTELPNLGGTNSQPLLPHDGTLIPESSSDETSGSKTITLTLPSDTETGTLKVVLNGKDVSSQFRPTSCEKSVCVTGTVTTSDGLVESKNVLYAVGKKSDGSVVSSRLRFAGPGARAFPVNKISTRAATGVAGIADTNFLPPTLSFSTISPGGWQGSSNKPWIQIGNSTYPDGNPAACPSGTPYAAIVLERATLEDADPSTPIYCVPANNVRQFLGSITPSELVVFGTLAGQTVAPVQSAEPLLLEFDTSLVGGTTYLGQESSQFPQGYMMIGVGQAALNSAYENYYLVHDYYGQYGQVQPNANGILVEDINGNYNYQPANIAEYYVNPSDTTIPFVPSQPTPSVTILNVPQPGQTYVYYAPAGSSNGFWLLRLNRNNLASDPACTLSGVGNANYYQCGQFFNTGSSDKGTAVTNITALVTALNGLARNELVVLVAVGMPIDGGISVWQAAEKAYTLANGSEYYPYYQNLAPALDSLGGVSVSTLSLNQPTSAYTLVSCSACGTPLLGNVALSTTAHAQQGQTGYIHGLLQPNLNGLYWPVRTSQETAGSGISADFSLDVVASQQPVNWPELSGILLPGASTVAGQVAAYHYISYQLITQYYIKGATGDYLDDIHYYFTGSSNSSIQYSTFDAVHLQFPGAANSCYAWTDPVTNTALDCFTSQDFQATASQVSAEVIYLDNVLQFMVTGTVNMKDVVVLGGNGNAGLALVQAASAVEGSDLHPSAATPVTSNTANILTLMSGVVDLGTAFLTDGLSEAVADAAEKASTIVSSIINGASGVAGGLVTDGGPGSPLPSPQYQFTTTIANLASKALQQQLSIGFDTQLDNILGNWGSLAAIGPKITDSSNPAFYSPTQQSQNNAIELLGQASQVKYYMALLPSFYSVQYYPGWYGNSAPSVTNAPDMGTLDASRDNEVCDSWYPWKQGFANVAQYYPSYAGAPLPWPNLNLIPASNPNPADWYILAGVAQNAGKSGAHGQTFRFLDSQVSGTLFGSGQLNLPFDEFVMPNGPMATVFLNAVSTNFDNWDSEYVINCANEIVSVGGAPKPNLTGITLTAPATAVLGEKVSFQATVKSAAGVPAGQVDIQEGTTVLGGASLDAKGNVSISVSGLSLGAHTVAAYFFDSNNFAPSNSVESTVMVYANPPDMQLSLSASSLQVSYGTTSSPVTVQVNSQFGMTGAITFSCTGVPVGMTCNFNPPQTMITDSGEAKTSLSISSAATASAGMLLCQGIGAVLLPFSLLCLWRINQGRQKIQSFLCYLLLLAVSFGVVLGCGSNSTPAQSTKETGQKTILVNVTCGSVTRTIPLALKIQ